MTLHLECHRLFTLWVPNWMPWYYMVQYMSNLDYGITASPMTCKNFKNKILKMNPTIPFHDTFHLLCNPAIAWISKCSISRGVCNGQARDRLKKEHLILQYCTVLVPSHLFSGSLLSGTPVDFVEFGGQFLTILPAFGKKFKRKKQWIISRALQ